MVHPAAWHGKKEAVTSCWAGRVPDWLQFLKWNSEMSRFGLYLYLTWLHELKRMYFSPEKCATDTFRARRGVNNTRWLELRASLPRLGKRWTSPEGGRLELQHLCSESCHRSLTVPQPSAGNLLQFWIIPTSTGSDLLPRNESVRTRKRHVSPEPTPGNSAAVGRSPLLRRRCVSRMEMSDLWHVSCLLCFSTTHFLPRA